MPRHDDFTRAHVQTISFLPMRKSPTAVKIQLKEIRNQLVITKISAFDSRYRPISSFSEFIKKRLLIKDNTFFLLLHTYLLRTKKTNLLQFIYIVSHVQNVSTLFYFFFCSTPKEEYTNIICIHGIFLS